MRGAVVILGIAAILLWDPLAQPPPASGQGDAGTQVRALTTKPPGRPAPCPKLDVSADPFVRGGCKLKLQDIEARISVYTVFGAMPFGECMWDMTARVGRYGELWVDELRVGGLSPCSDVWPCSPPAALKARSSTSVPTEMIRPWRGKLTSASPEGARGHLDMCFDTCVGKYKGRIDVSLVPVREGWALRATSQVGTGNLRVDAQWDPIAPGRMAFE